MDVDVQALCVEGGDAGRNDQTTGEHEHAIDASIDKDDASPLVGKKKKYMGVDHRVVKQRTITPTSKSRTSKDIVLVQTLAKGLFFNFSS
jgi:hypothetical protein